MPMPSRLMCGTVGLALALTLTACGGSDDQSAPISVGTGTPSPAATASPPPDAPELTADQQQAYQAALAVYTDYAAYVTRVSQEPDTTDQVNEILQLATPDAISSLNDEVQTLVANDAYVEGGRDVAWTVPVAVSGTEVVLEQCSTTGDWVLVGKDGQRAPQVGGSVNKVVLALVDGDWLVSSTDGGDRTC